MTLSEMLAVYEARAAAFADNWTASGLHPFGPVELAFHDVPRLLAAVRSLVEEVVDHECDHMERNVTGESDASVEKSVHDRVVKILSVDPTPRASEDDVSDKPTIVVNDKAEVLRLWEAHERSNPDNLVQLNGRSEINIHDGFMFETKWFRMRYETPKPVVAPIPAWAIEAAVAFDSDYNDDVSSDELARLLVATREAALREATKGPDGAVIPLKNMDAGSLVHAVSKAWREFILALIDKEPA